MPDSDNQDIDIDWEDIRDNTGVKYGGLGVGTIFQFAEHSPELVEDYTGIEVPKALFEDLFNPHEIDKGVHFYFSYSAATAMLETMEKTDRHISYPSKAVAVNAATIVGGSAKEMTDSWYDPMDMAANLAGANVALRHHRSRLEAKYEQEFGIGIEDYPDLKTAESLHYDLQDRDEELVLSEYSGDD